MADQDGGSTEGQERPSTSDEDTQTHIQTNTSPAPQTHGSEQIAGCINMLRNFTGTDPTYRAEHFFQDVDNVATVGRWSEQTKLVIVKSKFRERAAEFLSDNHELRATLNYGEFRNIVIDRFQAEEPLITRMHTFMSTCQKHGQDVRQYATILKNAAAKYFGTSEGLTEEVRKLRDETTMCQFVAGLSDSIKRQVLSRSPQTLSTSIDIAIQEEQNLALMGKRATVNAVENSQPAERDSELLSRTLQEMMKRMEVTERTVGQIAQGMREPKSGQTDSRYDTQNLARDNRPGNYGNGPAGYRGGDRQGNNESRYREQNRASDITCYRCQGRGHIARNCGTRLYTESQAHTEPKQVFRGNGRDNLYHNGDFNKFSSGKGKPRKNQLNSNRVDL